MTTRAQRIAALRARFVALGLEELWEEVRPEIPHIHGGDKRGRQQSDESAERSWRVQLEVYEEVEKNGHKSDSWIAQEVAERHPGVNWRKLLQVVHLCRSTLRIQKLASK
ncbi:MAG TPA: hypothetical protein VF814_21810 [Casimicrobiaceae bacterium]